MAKYTTTRTTRFTSVEFDAIPRYPNGDIIELTAAYPFITDYQREKLTDDDWSRMIELDEEISYLAAEFI
jgi:hypothetical protein